MLKTMKKALLLSLCISSFIFSMGQIAQSALTNAFSKSQIAQLVVSKMINQYRSFSNSPIVKCPGIPLVLTLQMANQTVKIETVNVPIKQESMQITSDSQDSIVIESQDISTNSEVSSDIKQIKLLNQNIPSYCIDLRPDQQTHDWQPSSTADNVQARQSYNATQAAQHVSEIIRRDRSEQEKDACFAKIKSEASSFFSNYQAIVQDRAYKFVDSSSSLSHQETVNKKAILEQELYPKEKALSEFIKKDPNFKDLLELIRNGSEDGTIRHDILEKLKTEDQYKALKFLNLNAEIEATKIAIQKCNCMIARPEQESRDFVAKLEIASVDEIEKIKQDLIAEKDALTSSFIEKNNERDYKDNELKAINFELALLNKKSWFAKAGGWAYSFFKSNDTKNNLANNKIKVIAEQQKIVREIELLSNERVKNDSQIRYVQNILNEKKEFELQEAQFLQEKQEALAVHEQIVKDQHDTCNFDSANCPDLDLEPQWAQRQEALIQTIDQGYAQYYQEYNLDPRTIAYLASCGIDYKEFQSFSGTALQQQLHAEICDNLSQAATTQTQLPYQNNLLTSVVDFADAAHYANKNNQVLLASQLLDVNCYLLKVNHQIITSILNDPIAYVKAAVSGIENGTLEALNMAAHPSETIKGLGKTLYYVLETASLNFSEVVQQHPEVLEPIRDQRNAEIAQGLKHLGEKFENARGPERFEALVEFGTNFVVSGKIIQAVGGVCGAIKSNATVLRTIEGAASMIEDEKIVEQVIQATEKVEVAVQENIAKNVTTELVEAGTKHTFFNIDHFIEEFRNIDGVIPIENKIFKDKFQAALEQLEKNLKDPMLEQVKKLYGKKIIDNKEIRVDLDHICNFELGLKESKEAGGYILHIGGGHLPGVCEALEQTGLVNIISKEKLPTGGIHYVMENAFTGKSIKKTVFLEGWTTEKIAQAVWDIYHNDSAVTMCGNGKFTKRGNFDGCELNIYFNISGNGGKIIENIVTCLPVKE